MEKVAILNILRSHSSGLAEPHYLYRIRKSTSKAKGEFLNSSCGHHSRPASMSSGVSPAFYSAPEFRRPAAFVPSKAAHSEKGTEHGKMMALRLSISERLLGHCCDLRNGVATPLLRSRSRCGRV